MKRKYCANNEQESFESPFKKSKTELNNLLHNTSFLALPPEKQLLFCKQKKQLMEMYWQEYEHQKELQNIQAAVSFFAKAYEISYHKALALFQLNTQLSLLSTDLPFIPQNPEEHFHAGLCYKLGLGVPVNIEKATNHIIIAAEQNHAEAQCTLALFYKIGLFFAKDPHKAFYWLEKAVKQNNIHAITNLAKSYLLGNIISKDLEKALFFFNAAAEQGDYYGLTYLASFLRQKPDHDKEKVLSLFTLAAEQGAPLFQCEVGNMYNSKGNSYLEKAFHWYKQAAEQNYADAQFKLGCYYEKGIVVTQDFEKALHWFTKAAEQNNPQAQYQLGIHYRKGIIVVQNSTEAIKWFTKAAELNHAIAQNTLGFLYHQGQCVTQNVEVALKWYTKAAEQNNATSQMNLGTLFFEGKGVSQNFENAVKWYTKAAEQNFSPAQNLLGMLYAKGDGVDQNLEKSLYWYTKAAKKNDIQAQENLGDLYFNGQGINQNKLKAIKWYRKAAEQKHAPALEKLKTMNDKLALYSLCWIKQDLKEISLLLTDPLVQKEFFKHDLVKIPALYKEEQFFTSFIDSMHLANTSSNDYSFLVECLLRLDFQIGSKQAERNEYMALFQTLLVNKIECSQIKRSQINPLIHFFCQNYFEQSNSTQEELSSFINPLIILWYRAQSLQMTVNELDSMNLFASVLINYTYKGAFQLQFSSKLDLDDISLLVFTSSRKQSLPVATINSLLKNGCLIENKTSVDVILIRLQKCLGLMINTSTPANPFFSQLYKLISNRNDSFLSNEKLFEEIHDFASKILTAPQQNHFFSYPLSPEEKQLAILLQQKNKIQLIHWCEEVEQNNCIHKLFECTQ